MLTKIAQFVHRLERLEKKEEEKKESGGPANRPFNNGTQKACFSWTSRSENSRLLASLLTLRF